MANRYWVGGTGTWDTSSTANWSATSGGAGGATAPTTADAVFFDANSGGGICTVGATVTCLTLNLTGYTGTLAFGTNVIKLSATNGMLFTQTTSCAVSGTPFVEFTSTGVSAATFRSYSAVGVIEANSVGLKVSAGIDNISLATGSTCGSIDFTGFSGTFARGGSNHTLFGSLTLSPTMVFGSNTGVIIFGATSGTQTITSNGKVINVPIEINAPGATVTVADHLELLSSRAFGLSNGTFNAADKNITVGAFELGAGTKTLILGSGTWTSAGNWNADTNVTGLTVSPSTGVINMSSASAKTFAGGGKTWPTLNQGGAGALTIQQANTFANITNTVQPATITFPASTTTTVGNFSVSGTSGNLITLNSSSAGTRATLSDVSGVNSVSFCDIKDINATGGATWNSFTSNGNVDSGNNVGWDFFAQAFRYLYTRRKNKVIYPL